MTGITTANVTNGYSNLQNNTENLNSEKTSETIKNKNGDFVIQASDLKIGLKPTVEELKQERTEYNVKTRLKQMYKDLERSGRKEENLQKIHDLYDEKKQCLDEVNRLEAQRNQMKEEYGITDDSLEEKEVQVLKKAESKENLTKEEVEILKSIDMDNLTEYQKYAIDNFAIQSYWEDLSKGLDKQILETSGAIRAQDKAEAGFNPMVDINQDLKNVIKAYTDRIKEAILESIRGEQENENKESINNLIEAKINEEMAKGAIIDEKI